jgi:predicted metalloprotease with PDZ domain
MLGRSLLFAFILIGLAEIVSAKPAALQISVEPAGAVYRVSVTFIGEADGTTDIRLPNEWGGQQELFKSIRNISASKGVTLTDTEQPFVKTLRHQPDQKITVTYELANGFEGVFRNDVRYRPVVGDSYIHWIGNAVWALPAWDDSAEVKAKFEWKNFPKQWTIANSFDTEKRAQVIRKRLGELRQAVFVAGDFRIVRTKAAGNPVNIAIRGKWQFADAELAEMTRRIVEVERDFFEDHSQKYYLVTLVPIDGGGPNSISTGGTGLTDSFALFSTSNARLDLFRRLLAHEYVHNWIPGKLGRMPARDEQSLYWFSEGFTDFYTYELLRRGNLILDAEYVERYNELIREYYMLPVREAPNERILRDFWTNRDVQRLPYLRGLMFATNLNSAIKRASNGKHSLDNVIRDLFNSSKFAKSELSLDSLATAFKVYLTEEPMPMMKRHLIDGELVVPASDALGPSITQETIESPVYELGFDFDKFAKDRVVADLDPDSAAYAAGLRNGQQRTAGFSLMFGDTKTEIELKVKDTGGDKTIRFLPVARKPALIPQYKLAR